MAASTLALPRDRAPLNADRFTFFPDICCAPSHGLQDMSCCLNFVREISIMDWRHEAVCRDEDPELFFPVGNSGPALLTQIAKAKLVCNRCPVATSPA